MSIRFLWSLALRTPIQHDARFHSNNNSQISIFDNGATSWDTSEATARGLLINLDYSNLTATLAAEAIPLYNLTVAKSQGNVQIQQNGNMMIGWGQMPCEYRTQYQPTGLTSVVSRAWRT